MVATLKTINYCAYIKTFHLNLKSYIYYLTYHSNKVTYYQCDLFFIFHRCIVNLQCYVNFWFIASDSVLHIYMYVCIYILFHIFFHYSFLKDIQYSSLSDLLHLVKSSSMIIYNAGDPGSVSGSGRSPGEGNGNPLQYSCLENPMDGGAW